mgnify:FL=1
MLFIIQVIIILILFILIIYMLKYNISLKNERRIGKYSIEPIKVNSESIYDKIAHKYTSVQKKLRPLVSKIFKRHLKRYEKYEVASKDIKAVDYVTTKIIISISFALLTTFALVLQSRVMSLFELIIYLIFGFYIFDIILNRKEKNDKKKIENQLLRGIIIMNNAFKAGNSTIQALKIACDELPEPIKGEFSKMYKEMCYGLSVEVVFDRFAKRVDLEEAKYISSSLIILNKTGGNIINVFSSIERTLYDKKKLREEQKSLIVSSDMVVKVLFCLPIIFVGIIYLLSPDYFSVLFNSILGYLVLGIMLIMFIIYVILLRKILKVKV